jgi:cell wall assembly regulator SMI1
MLRSVFDIDGLIGIVCQQHAFTPARSEQSIVALEHRVGLPLPADLRRFYTVCDGARLFSGEYVLIDPDGILPFSAVIRALQDRELAPSDAWIAFCRTRDGHWLGLDLAGGAAGQHHVAVLSMTGDSTPGRLQVVAPSFACFLAFALVGHARPYWSVLPPMLALEA